MVIIHKCEQIAEFKCSLIISSFPHYVTVFQGFKHRIPFIYLVFSFQKLHEIHKPTGAVVSTDMEEGQNGKSEKGFVLDLFSCRSYFRCVCRKCGDTFLPSAAIRSQEKAVFCIKPVSFHDSTHHHHIGVFTVGAHKLVGLYRGDFFFTPKTCGKGVFRYNRLDGHEVKLGARQDFVFMGC